MWQTVQIPPSHFVNSLRASFGKCGQSSYKQMGLRRLRDADLLSKGNPERSIDLIREATQLLLQARAFDERVAYRVANSK